MEPYKLKEIRRFKIGLCQSVTSLLVLGLIFFVGDWIAKIAMAVLCIAPGFWLFYSWQGYRWLKKQTNVCYALVIDENGMQMGYDNGDVVLSWDKISGVRFLRKKVEDGGRLGVLVVIQKDGEEVIYVDAKRACNVTFSLPERWCGDGKKVNVAQADNGMVLNTDNARNVRLTASRAGTALLK